MEFLIILLLFVVFGLAFLAILFWISLISKRPFLWGMVIGILGIFVIICSKSDVFSLDQGVLISIVGLILFLSAFGGTILCVVGVRRLGLD